MLLLLSWRIIFQSTSSIQRKTCPVMQLYPWGHISIHFLYTEEDHSHEHINAVIVISIHFLYTEEDSLVPMHHDSLYHFNPLPLYRGRHACFRLRACRLHFNPLPLYRGRPQRMSPQVAVLTFQSTSSIQRKTNLLYMQFCYLSFQSTSSIQRKTRQSIMPGSGKPFQSTSSIQRKTIFGEYSPSLSTISIHFLYTEEDEALLFDDVREVIFQSTSSIQRKTQALLAGRPEWTYFNPLPLYRGRQQKREQNKPQFTFQSTSSIQRKTWPHTSMRLHQPHFNPLPLYRGRHHTPPAFL